MTAQTARSVSVPATPVTALLAPPVATAGGQDIAHTSRADFTSLSDRMSHLLVLRVAIGWIVALWAVLAPSALVLPLGTIGLWTAAYLTIAVVGEWARQRTTRFNYWILTGLLLLDGIYLAAAMYATGGTQSPIRFVVYLHLVGVSLLASYRTGLKIALWHSLLLFVLLYAQAARLVTAIDVTPASASNSTGCRSST